MRSSQGKEAVQNGRGSTEELAVCSQLSHIYQALFHLVTCRSEAEPVEGPPAPLIAQQVSPSSLRVAVSLMWRLHAAPGMSEGWK